MKESPLRLQDKAFLLFGPFNGLSQSLMRNLTEQGADVGFVNPEQPFPAKFIENLNDGRQIHPEFGRAAPISIDVKDTQTAKEACGKMAELLGRIDGLIDLNMSTLAKGASTGDCFAVSKEMAEQVMPYLLGRKRGKILFIREDDFCADRFDAQLKNHLMEEFVPFMQSLGGELKPPHYTSNLLRIGLTEDFLLQLFPKSPSIRSSLEKLQAEVPGVQLVDFQEISNASMFSVSSMSNGISHQWINVNRGHNPVL